MRQVFQQQLFSALISLQSQLQQGLSEYSLLQILQSPPYSLIDKNALRDSLSLFRCHFVLFNALYQLRCQWLKEKHGVLSIHATQIKLAPYQAMPEGLTTEDPLQSYYLDWQNFTDTSKQDVDGLIDGFWRQMAGEKGLHVGGAEQKNAEQEKQARQVLLIAEATTLSLPLIKRQYKKLLHQLHPDKGGNEDEAKMLIWAYQLLRAQIDVF
ncbi:molecular chaperone DnaJ [Alteromonas pelagimontana]|uniref:Molecular chaperone DnaJ n=1 Tax=Alteromonas pelagimontana TaxID=1858656 RepID=A0A6M4MDB0_9ALTE|nr:DNA-J related domain-containing protein [Alteromonas pelagimontana]QJR81171.1 molecular chaperone DnaJ [Alteromonas pelagimontana]